MARDYKYRVQNKSSGHRKTSANPLQSIGFWKWMLITALVISFVVFLVYLQTRASQHADTTPVPQISATKPLNSESSQTAAGKQKEKKESGPEHKQPRFDFYTILPEKEVVVPDYEINTRTREERVGKTKEAHYMMQAGSFKAFKEADTFRAKLGLLGIESKVHKVKVGNVNWYRVKIGPYAQMTSVSAIKSRLRQNGIDVIITESGE